MVFMALAFAFIVAVIAQSFIASYSQYDAVPVFLICFLGQMLLFALMAGIYYLVQRRCRVQSPLYEPL